MVLAGSYAAALNTTIVGVALPDVAADLGSDPEGLDVDWVITSFLVGVVLIQPATGWFADRWGRRSVYVASLAVFCSGALIGTLAPVMPALLVGRFIQGLGGGAVMPVGMTIVFERFAPHQRGRALGVWGVGIAGAPAAGPPIGGWLVSSARRAPAQFDPASAQAAYNGVFMVAFWAALIGMALAILFPGVPGAEAVGNASDRRPLR